MLPIIDYDILKYTGKSGYERVVNSISFKNVDTATYLDDSDSMNYPVYAPYLEDYSLSYENWSKIRLKFKPEILENVNSRGITIKVDDCGFCYNRTYTKITNISMWFDSVPSTGTSIKLGISDTYRRPIDGRSDIAVESIETYYSETEEYDGLIKMPLYFNGKDELLISEINGATLDDYIVWQLEIFKGSVYQLEPKTLSIRLHYDLV